MRRFLSLCLITVVIILVTPVYGIHPPFAHSETVSYDFHSLNSSARNGYFVVDRPRQTLTQTSGSWNSLGPDGIFNCAVMLDASWNPVTGDYCSGRVTSIALDPINPSTIYLGTAGGGVWKTSDGGSSWIPLTDDQRDLAIGSVAVDSNGVVYAGTGEGNNALDSQYGVGILRSSDGGNTWTLLGSSMFLGSAITKIVINPQDSNSILVATNSNTNYGSTTTSLLVAAKQPSGIYVSNDGGQTWSATLTATQQMCGSNLCEASDLVMNPNDPSQVYAAVAGGIYKSTDGGMTWRWLAGVLGTGLDQVDPPGRISLAMSGNSLFAAGDVVLNPNGNPPDGGVLVESNDGGNSWMNLTTPTNNDFPSFCVFGANSQCWYDLYVAVDPTDASTIYLGGMDLWRTTDSGSTWVDLGGYIGGIHPDQHVLAFSPQSHDMIYVGNDGGIWYSKDGSECNPSDCWINLNSGLVITQATSLAAHPSDPEIVFGGAQDNSEWELSDSGVWSMLDSGDSGWVGFDRNSPLTMYHTYYGTTIARSDNGGASDGWQYVTTGIASDDPHEFYVPVAMDPGSPTTLYLGTYRLYKTTDSGNEWISVAELQRPTDCSSGECISAIAVAPSDDTYVYIGTNSGQVFVSEDGGNTFNDVSQGLPNAPVTKIAVDQSDPTKVYVGFLEFTGSRLMASGDAGASWNDISSALPNIPVTALVVGQDGSIYAGMTMGVYESPGGTNWSTVGSGLPNAPIRDLVFSANGTLMAATYGRGIWSYVPEAGTTPSVSNQQSALGIVPPQQPSSVPSKAADVRPPLSSEQPASTWQTLLSAKVLMGFEFGSFNATEAIEATNRSPSGDLGSGCVQYPTCGS